MGVLDQTRMALAAVLLVVAASASAADCFTEYKLISEHGIQPNRPAAASAWNGSILGVIRTNNNGPVILSRYDANLNPITENAVSASIPNGPVTLLAGGDRFAIVFMTASGAIIFQQITAIGARDGGEIQIGASHGVFPSQEFDATWNPQLSRWEIAYTVTNGPDGGLWVASIAPGQAPVERRIQFFLSDPAVPRIAVANNGAIAVSWFRPNNNTPTLFVNLYDANYTQLGSLLVSTTASMPRLAANATSFALAYQSPVSGGTELRWVRFDSAARVIANDARLVIGSGIDVAPVHLLWNPTLSEWALTYVDAALGLETFPGDYRIRRLNANGALISDALFTPDITKSILSGKRNFTWTGSAYVGSIERFFSQAEGSDSYLVKHCPLLASVKATNLTPVPNQPFTFTATATGGLPPYSYSWDFGDLSEQRTEQTFAHGYARTGTYTVTLTVTDALGDRAVVTQTVTVVDTVRRRPTRR